MTLMTCAAVQRRLQAFYDRELQVGDLIAIEGHLHDCPPCTRDLNELQTVGHALKLAAAPAPSDDWTGVRSSVISRMRAEAHESWTAQVRRAFDDLHLVWIGLASTAATCLCAGAVLSMLHFAAPKREDSLAAVIAVMASPTASEWDLDQLDATVPRPGLTEDEVLSASGNLVLPLSVIVTREGPRSNFELASGRDLRDVMDVVDALSRSRLEPAQFPGSSVAVNVVSMRVSANVQAELMHSLPGGGSWQRHGVQRLNLVWLVAHTTVRGKARS
jgi:Putative zinc-finger